MDGTGYRFAAALWVVAVGKFQWLLLVLGALSCLVLSVVTTAWVAGLGAAAVIGGLAAGWRALVLRYEAQRRTAWQLMVVLEALLLALAAVGLVRQPGFWSALATVLPLTATVLLAQPDSRDWVAPAEASPPDAPPRRAPDQRGRRPGRVPTAGSAARRAS